MKVSDIFWLIQAAIVVVAGLSVAVIWLLDVLAQRSAQRSSPSDRLFEAALTGNAKLAQRVLSKGGDVNARDEDGATALHAAAYQGSTAVVELLLAQGANANAQECGYAPLHAAAIEGHTRIAELLLAHGADVNAKDGNGHTALHDAVAEGQNEVAELLRRRGGAA